MTGVKAKIGIHLSVTTDESHHDGVEVNIMESSSPCQSPALSPAQPESLPMESPPLSPTRAAFRKIFDSLEQEQATRQSPSPIDNDRESYSIDRQSPSLASDSSSTTTSNHAVNNDSKTVESEAGNRASKCQSNVTSKSLSNSVTNSNHSAKETESPHRESPSEFSEESSSSSTSGDIMNKETRIDRYDVSPQVSGSLVDRGSPQQLSPKDRIEATTSLLLEDRMEHILAEARSFASSNAPVSSPKNSTDTKRRDEIIEEARRQAGKTKDTPRMRTTEEVLQMAGALLSSRSRSPGISPQVSRESGSPRHSVSPRHKMSHVSHDIPQLEKNHQDWDPQVQESTSSISDDEIAHQMNVIRNTPLHQVLSDDSIKMRKASYYGDDPEAKKESASGLPKYSLLGFLKNDHEDGPTSPEKRRITTLSSAFGCNSRAVENVISNDDEEDTPNVQLNSMLQKRLSKFNLFSCRESILSLDEDDRDSTLSPTNSMLKPPPFHPHPLSSSEGLRAAEVDPRMPIWMTEHGAEVVESASAPEDTFYTCGPSRAIIVHEIVRGDWTWCTAWSPDGGRLAIATENHHLAVVETTASSVWRVRHDQRINGPVKHGTTHSIRSIAWGQNFIAIGGTGNAVSILAPIEPYPILHTILDTGFVGSLSWRKNSNVLAIGSREDKCLVVNIAAADGEDDRHIQSTILETISRPDWVNAVAFSRGGTALAIGDRSGTLSLYSYHRKKPTDIPSIAFLRKFMLEDSVLAVEWSPDEKWLYAGGEDFTFSVIDSTTWTIVHTIPRKKWIQFVSSSNRGTHVAVGGVASEVSILDTRNNWEQAFNIELKGMVPLSAEWHPRDQYLALTGQNNSVIAVETTNARHVHGHCLHSASPVLQVEFSPDGRMVVIGNEAGTVSFFSLEGSVFVTAYEMVLMSGESQSIRWSRNGHYVIIGTGDQVIVVSKISSEKMEKMPPGATGFSVRKVIRGLGKVRSISIDHTCRYVAVGGTNTLILDAADQFSSVREWKKRIVQCNAFSPDGTWLASIGRNENLTIYNTSSDSVNKWRVVFTLKAERAGLALAWGPTVVNGLQYLAYGGANNMITIIEIRTKEETWETVLEVRRAGVIHDLDWNRAGMLAAAIGDGTVTIIDLEYLQSGWAMNEMDYTWQRQGITCFTEVRRNKGKNSMRTVRWIPSLDQSLVAIGGTDGSLEIVDLTERRNCQGFVKADSQRSMTINE